MRQSSISVSHNSSPVKRFRAITCALSVSMKTRSPATAAPRLAPPPTIPLVRGRLRCQTCRPLPASSAKISFGAVTYISPSTTIGVPCSAPTSGIDSIHLGASRLTVVLSIWVSVV